MSFSQDERDVINRIDDVNKLALTQYNNGNIKASIKSIDKAIKLSDSIQDDYGIATANFTLGEVYTYMNEPEDAYRCYSKMLETSEKIEDNYLVAMAHLRLGEFYKNNTQLDKVIPYYTKALEYGLKNEVTDQENKDKKQEVLFEARMKLSDVLLYFKRPDEAFKYLLRAEDNLDNSKTNSYNEAYLSYMYAGYFEVKEAYFKAGSKYEEALMFAIERLKNPNSKSDRLVAKIYKSYSLLSAKMGNEKLAYNLLLEQNRYREQILNEEVVKQENLAKSKIHIAELKNLASIADKEIMLQAETASKMRTINYIILFAIGLLLISTIIVYKNYLSKRKLNDILEARNEQLEIAKVRAEKSSKLQTSFISNVTHELRTPLYGVVGLTSLLLKSNDLSEKDSKFLKSLKFSGDYLLNLINDILQIGKIESDEVELHEINVDIRALMQNIMDSFEYRMQENNNKIHLYIDDKLPKFVKCDNVRLSQILINLIGNSIKFTKNGQIVLKVIVLKGNDKNVSLRFVIKDNGPGIPKDMHERIFENFSQLNDNNVDYNGTGLGLPISKKLVEMFNSKIELVSEVGMGSEFSFKVDFKVEEQIQLNVKKSTKAISMHKKHKILVAEDNKINQIVTKNILQKGNFECVVMENGLDALNEFKKNEYDLILMDLNMPIMNGTEATQAIRKINKNVPIIALTAAEVSEMDKDFYVIGFDDIITKPFDNFQFFQKIAVCIEKAQQKKEGHLTLTKVS